MKTRKTKRGNTIRRVIAFLLCMTMVLGLGMQDVMEQVYAEEPVSTLTEESDTPAEESTEPKEDSEQEESTEPKKDSEQGETTETKEESVITEEPKKDTSSDTSTVPGGTAPVEEGSTDGNTTPATPNDNTTPAGTTETNTEASGSKSPAQTTPDGNTTSTVTGEATTEVTDPSETTEKSDPSEVTEPEEADENLIPEEETAKPYEAEQKVDNVTIHVSAEAGVLPEDAELSVTPIEKKEITENMSEEEKAKAEEINAQYEETEQKLKEDVESETEAAMEDAAANVANTITAENAETGEIAGKTLEGFLAYDISFLVQDENGEKVEIEPEGDVKVSFEFDEAVIPEGVSEGAEVAVKHLKEDENAESGIVVEDVTENAEVTINESAAVEAMSLTTDSFSTFAITWSSDNRIDEKAVPEIKIEDNILQRGSLDAVLSDGVTAVKYEWYKQNSENEFEPVEKINYVNGGTNISDEGTFLYPAYDDGARATYKVKATLQNGTIVESAAYQVPYFDELQNGSFEKIELPYGQSHEQFGNAEYKNLGGVWQSTGVGKGVSIEIIKEGWTGGSDYSWYGDFSDAAPDGQQFAEINCEAAGAFYQDVLTQEGNALNYALQHRARGSYANGNPEYDTMYLVIMPTSEAEKETLTTQENLRRYLGDMSVNIDQEYENVGSQILKNEEGICVVRITSNDQQWHEVRGTGANHYMPTSSLTRFFFVAGATASGNNTVGNFLDDVHFTQSVLEPAEDEFTLNIEKKFEGLGSEELQKVKDSLKFTISAKDETNAELSEAEIKEIFGYSEILGSQMNESADGSLFFSIADKKIQPGKNYAVTVTESGAELEGYSLTTEVQTKVERGVSEPVTDDNAVIENLTGKTIAWVTYKNTYTKSQTKNINFTKVWDDAGLKQLRPDSVTVQLKATANGNDITEWLKTEQAIETEKVITAGDNWKCTWEDVPVYYTKEAEQILIEYTVAETETTGSDYVYKSKPVEKGDGTTYVPTVSGLADSDSSMALAANSVLLPAASASADGTGGLGEPEHHKRVEYNEETGDYTLTLDVKGARGEAKGADILFVIDTSGSMGDNGLLKEAKDLLNGSSGWWGSTDGIIDKIFETEGNVNSVAYVAFAGYDDIESSGWYTADNYDPEWGRGIKDEINGLRAGGGTNWTAAMQEASDVLAQRDNSGNEKVVIFLSDGAPTYSMGYYDEWVWDGLLQGHWEKVYGQTGNGSSSKDSHITEAADEVNNSTSLKNATIYSVYLNNSTKDGMESFADLIPGCILQDGSDLSSALTSILQQVIPTYKNVKITDTLSVNAEFAEENPTITVTKQTASGRTETLSSDKYHPTINGETVTVEIKDGDSLEEYAVYTVSFRIKPSAYAEEEYAETHTYPDRGDAGTGSASSGHEGFYSNDIAKVTYEVNDTPGEAIYDKPVIQIPEPELTNITVTKEWENGGTPEPVEVVLMQSEDGGDAEKYEDSVILKEGEWSYTWTGLPLSQNGHRYTYAVREVTVLDGFESRLSLNDTDPANLKWTLTNVYDPNTADENFYIANVLQTDKVTIQKKWDDQNDILDVRPDQIEVQIADGSGRLYTVSLKASSEWQETIIVPRTTEQKYSVSEKVVIDQYEMVKAKISGQDTGTINVELENKLTTRSITVEKNWKDGNIPERPNSISFTLIGKDSNGAVKFSKNYNLSAPEWEITIDDLPAYYDYEVQEANTGNGYISSVSQRAKGFVITNTLQWKAVKMSKALESGSGMVSQPLAGAEFELKFENELIAKGTSDVDGTIEWEFQEGSEMESNNLNGRFQIHETKAPDGYMLEEQPWTVEFDNGLLVSLNGEPQQGSADNGVVITLENEMLYELPSTGGPGVYLYMLGGTLLMMAGTLLVYKKRKEEVLRG